MKKLLLVFAVLTVFAIGANAQLPVPFSLYAGGALSVPSSPDGFKDGWNTGYHGMAGIGFKMAPIFQVIGKAEYHNFGYDFGDVTDMDGGNAKIWLFGADGRLSLNLPASPVAPFIFGGAGMANIKQSDFSGTNLIASTLNEMIPDSQNKFYYNVGVGFETKLGPSINFFGQGRYVSIDTDGTTTKFIPITFGLKFF